MRRRQLVFGSLAGIVYVACGGDGAPESEPGQSTSSVADLDASVPPSDTATPLPPTSSQEQSDRVFPQGLASGDPRPDRVLLWTRIEPASVGKTTTDDVAVRYVIARDADLDDIAAEGEITAFASSDHTLRLVPTGLDPGRVYYYRFESGGVTTQVGRTKTAPEPDADVSVKFVFCSCQDFIGRYYHSWRALIEEKLDLDYVLFLGDYIYESVNDPKFQSTTPEREITLPDGMDTSDLQDKSKMVALTLADYRHLYKTYRSDPFLKEVHRLYPFIIGWDDHEFSDDCWQDHSTYFAELDPATHLFTDEKNTARRTAANRAFFEYQPLDVPYEDGQSFPSDIKIYRTLKWGRHVEVFVTDQRSYRDDHVIPEGPTNFDVRKLSKSTSIGARYFVRKPGFDPIEAAAKPTLLGATQKEWLLGAMMQSTATWKVWANEVQMYEMAIDLELLPGIPAFIGYVAYPNVDQWDGYRSERKEILAQLDQAGLQNLLVLTGDIHSFYAAELHVDFAAPQSKPVGVEYVTAGISSASMQAIVDSSFAEGSLFRPVADAWTGNAEPVLEATNPHLRYADTDAYGFGIVSIDATKVDVTFVQLGDPREKNFGGVVSRQQFVTPVGSSTITRL